MLSYTRMLLGIRKERSITSSPLLFKRVKEIKKIWWWGEKYHQVQVHHLQQKWEALMISKQDAILCNLTRKFWRGYKLRGTKQSNDKELVRLKKNNTWEMVKNQKIKILLMSSRSTKPNLILMLLFTEAMQDLFHKGHSE